MEQFDRTKRRIPPVRLATAVAALALMPLLAAPTARAQDQTAQVTTAAAPPAEPLETIQVTGSRINNADAASANPITVVGTEQIDRQQSTTVEDVLRKVPAVDFSGGATSGTANGGLGASEVSLRNLTPQRTLILVNGVRFPFTDNQASADAVDMNNIPVPMIDHIDILRDGASSIYGADAIAGVINVVTKQHFEGVEVGSSFGESSYGDAQRYEVLFDGWRQLRPRQHPHQRRIFA